MDRSSIALGKGYSKEPMVKSLSKATGEERLAILERQVEDMLKLIMILRYKIKGRPAPEAEEIPEEIQAPHGLNKDGLPNELVCIGETEKQQFPLCMTIKPDCYQVGIKSYPSLSAAAEAVSGVRRSGWTFWKLPDGRTLKEAFNKK